MAESAQQEGENYWMRNLPDELSDEEQLTARDAFQQRPNLGFVRGSSERGSRTSPALNVVQGGTATSSPVGGGGLLRAFPFGWTPNLFRRKRASEDEETGGGEETEEGDVRGKKKQLSLQQRRQQARRAVRLIELIMNVDLITIPIMLLDWHKDLILGNLFKIDAPGVAPLTGWELGALLFVDLVFSCAFLGVLAIVLVIFKPCLLTNVLSEGFLKFLKPVIDMVCEIATTDMPTTPVGSFQPLSPQMRLMRP